MQSRPYPFSTRESRARERDELAATLAGIERHLATLAEAERRRAAIRACRFMERRERRERRNRRNLT